MSPKKLTKNLRQKILIHTTAEVSPRARIGFGTKIWHQAQIRGKAILGKNCVISKGVYIDQGVVIGDDVHIQNYSCIYEGVYVQSGVFIGTGVSFATDLNPRSLTISGKTKKRGDWTGNPIIIKNGASIGSGSVILGKVNIGQFAMVGAGSVVTADVCDHGLVRGNPARLVGFVCRCGYKAQLDKITGLNVRMVCSICKSKFTILRIYWDKIEPNDFLVKR